MGASDSTATARPAPPAALRPTDRGVSATEIRLGWLVGDTGNISRAGYGVIANVELFKRTVDFWVNYINRNGGVLGRRLNMRQSTFDLTRPEETMRPACLEVVEDHQAFWVSDFALFRKPLCVTEEARALFSTMAGSYPDEFYARSQGRLLDWSTGADRLARAWAARLHADGALKGKKIGAVWDARPHSKLPIERVLIPELKRLGYDVVATTELSGTDLAQGQSQVPVEVAKHQQQGVEVEIFAASQLYLVTWAQAADNTLFTPLYTLSDINAGVTDSVQGHPDSFRAVSYSAYPSVVLNGPRESFDYRGGGTTPEPPVAAECKRIYEAETGTKVTGDPRDDSDTEYVVGTCRELLFFRAVAEAVGPDLTTASYVRKVAEMPNLNHWTLPVGSSIRPDKAGAPNHLRKVVWKRPCPNDPHDEKRAGCYVPASGWFPLAG